MFKLQDTKAFALPSILIASVVMLMVLVTAITAVVATRTALDDQYYRQLASEAAESGTKFLIACMKRNEVPVAGLSYSPNATSCTDAAQSSTISPYVLQTSLLRSTFTTRIVTETIDDFFVESTGRAELIRQSNGDVWRTNETTIKVTISKKFLSITNFSAVTRGYNMYVVRPDGSLWAWGRNSYGEIGSGAAAGSNVSAPTQIIGNGVAKVVSSDGSSSTYAIMSDGSLWAWGRNANGQLGDNTTVDKIDPVMIISSGVIDVYSYRNTTYAVRSDGSLWAWGQNNYGLVGNNSTVDQLVPVRVVTSGVRELLGAQSNSAVMYLIKSDGSLWAWGQNNYGLVGNGVSTGQQLTPVSVIASGVKQITISEVIGSASALMIDGTVRRWGYSYTTTPVTVTGLSSVSRLVGTSQSTYAITTTGALYSYGANTNGTIGNGVNGSRVNAPYMVFSCGVTDVGTSRFQSATIALRSDGTLWGWGLNNYCQQADGTTINHDSPVQIMTNVASMYSYSRGSYGAGAAAPRFAAVTRDGSLYAWGSNMLGAIGNGVNEGALAGGTSQCTPYKVMDNVLLVADSDYYTTFVITADYNVWSFGANNMNQIGRTGSNALPGRVLLPEIPPMYY